MKEFDHVSKSKILMLFRCDQQWAFRYPMDLIRPPNGNMSFGSAWHDGAGFDFHQKVESGKNLPAKESVEYAVTSLEARREETEWEGEKFSDAKASLVALQTEYANDLAQEVQPIEGGVEQETWVELESGVRVLGYIDVVTAEGSIDLKSTKRKWPEGDGQKKIEPFLYTIDEPGDSVFGFHVGIRKKKPEVQEVIVKVAEKTKVAARGLIDRCAIRMRELIADPERALPSGFGSWACTKRQCGYHRECTKRWGLPIPD